MRFKKEVAIVAHCLILFIFFGWDVQGKDSRSLKKECLKTLFLLSNSLVDLQIKEKTDANYGAIRCPGCDVLHTRAAEAVYPLAVASKHSGDSKYLQAAIRVGNWLISQQNEDGSWNETPQTWTGTTADQGLMMSCAFPLVSEHLSSTEKVAWKACIKKATDYLVRVMSPDFASINYNPTTATFMIIVNKIIPDERYTKKARELARWTVAKMDEDGFITGEGARVFGVKYGVDLGYEMDMSLWGLGLYAKLTGDSLVNESVRKSLHKNLYFVYPNGSIDASWGIRSYKWTTYGSKTADGCQILFSLYAPEDARYRTAAIRNLEYLRGMIKDGLIGYGPHFWDVFDKPPCNYPTFVRAKNLALAVEFGEQEAGETPPLPTEQTGWVKFFPTVDVALARSENFMVTVTAYRYKDVTNWGKGKYTHHPSGGSISNLWVKDHGFLQTSSQTRYIRGEPMHMPVLQDSVICLTPRLEFRDKNGYFTNLYECDGRISVKSDGEATAIISTAGEFNNEQHLPGGVAYIWTHKIFNDKIEKSVHLRYHDKQPEVRIVEPIVQYPGMTFQLVNDRTVLIQGGKRDFQLELVTGNATIELGRDESHYWYLFPSMKCYPVVLKVPKPEESFKQEIVYRISILK